jgi:branched-chain amino acid transport system permease protein
LVRSQVAKPRWRATLTPWLILVVVLTLILGRVLYLVGSGGSYTWAFFTGALLSSLQLGSLYALIALGYTLVYGIIRLINFAHGEVFMVGAFSSYFLFANTPYSLPWALFAAAAAGTGFMYALNLWRGKVTDPVVLAGGLAAFAGITYALSATTLNWVAAMVLSMLTTGVVGILLDRIAYRPLRGAPRISLLITAIAMSFFMQNAGLLLFTRNQTPYRPDTTLPEALQFPVAGSAVTSWTQFLQFQVAGSTVYTSAMVILILSVTLLLVVALTLFVSRMRLGKAMRATAQDPEVAQMMGVNVNRVIATTFFLGSLLAAAAGVLWGLNFGSLTQPAVFGLLPGLKAFAAAVIGGIGSLPGAVIGGLLLGFLENFVPAMFSGVTEYKDTFAFFLLIIILLIRPSGIIGEDLSEKV